MMTEYSVEVENLGKDFGPVRALNTVSFQVRAGSYFVLLGPSGGGKTTILRLIGGFERPSRGHVRLMGQDVTELPPNKRGSTMVFQNYALFPHMNVERNVGYGLKLRRLPKQEIRERMEAMLEMVGLAGLNRRMPNELSGGQQQRVQLARSLVLGTDILLLDEPLASLDAKLRKEMCLELKHIQERVGITFLHVTHNQEEAMTIADRIAVIADGDLIEEAAPREIYETPQTSFTAGFIGENNLFRGRIEKVEADHVTAALSAGKVRVPRRGLEVSEEQEVTVSIRSELLTLTASPPEGDGNQSLPAKFVEHVFLGLTTHYLSRLEDGQQVLVRGIGEGEGESFAPGAPLHIVWETKDGLLLVK